jgi:3-methyladenine DNA glycosylase AlkD
MKAEDARELGGHIAALVQAGKLDEAYVLLTPLLATRTPFRALDLVAEAISTGPLEQASAFLEQIAANETMGGWVIIATALGCRARYDLAGAFARCRQYIIVADVWHATDTFGERVTGPALVADFQPALDVLSLWRQDTNRWVRRNVGVAVHFWAKRARGAPEQTGAAKDLLAFLEPMFEERDPDAVKGVGWGLKTLGRHFPELVVAWLREQTVQRNRSCRALILRKALTYLSEDQRARATGGAA